MCFPFRPAVFIGGCGSVIWFHTFTWVLSLMSLPSVRPSAPRVFHMASLRRRLSDPHITLYSLFIEGPGFAFMSIKLHCAKADGAKASPQPFTAATHCKILQPPEWEKKPTGGKFPISTQNQIPRNQKLSHFSPCLKIRPQLVSNSLPGSR